MDPVLINVFHVMERATWMTENALYHVRMEPTQTRELFNATRVIPPATRVMVLVVVIVLLVARIHSMCPVNVYPVDQDSSWTLQIINATLVMQHVIPVPVQLMINVHHVRLIHI